MNEELRPGIPALVDQITDALQPILDGKRTVNVLEALALSFLVAVRASRQDEQTEYRLMNAYARLILEAPEHG
jgi:hypothetical protein